MALTGIIKLCQIVLRPSISSGVMRYSATSTARPQASVWVALIAGVKVGFRSVISFIAFCVSSGFCERLGPADYHHALPAAAIADFFDLQTDLWVCVDVLSLHALSG